MTTLPGRVVPLFSTPVMTENWGGEEMLAELSERTLKRRRETDGVSLSNVLGWQSDDGMADWGGPAAQALLHHVRSRCNAITCDVLNASRDTFDWGSNMWANVSENGHSNQTHCHPGAYWSAVYYIDDGYGGDPDVTLGGELVFLDPRMPMVRMGMPDLRYRRPDGSIDHQEIWLRPAQGRLVIFPSWLMHSVRPYRGNGTRLSIAINLSARPKLQPDEE